MREVTKRNYPLTQFCRRVLVLYLFLTQEQYKAIKVDGFRYRGTVPERIIDYFIGSRELSAPFYNLKVRELSERYLKVVG